MTSPIQAPATVGVRVSCPSCGEAGILAVEVASRLFMVEGERSKLSVRSRTQALPHICGQLTIQAALDELEQGGSDD